MPNFKGRVAIVTGAASGIGKEIAIRLAAQGAIPVIQSDYIVEPFEAYFDWRKLSVRLLNNRTAELRDILLAVRADAAALDCKQATIRAVAPYFFWSQCSPGACKPADLLVLAL